MFRSLFLVAFSSLIIFGCKARDKSASDSGNALGGGGDLNQSVESQPMSFNSEGSDSGTIAGLATIYFDYDKSTLSQAAREILKSNVEWMKKNSSVKVQIEGHTDNRGSIEYNIALGERRANSVKNYLTTLGVQSSQLTVISYGEEKPLMSGEADSAWSKNRRANFVPAQ